MTWRLAMALGLVSGLVACGVSADVGTLEDAGGGTTGGTTSGAAAITPPYGYDTATEYHVCTSNAQCTAPEQCTSVGTFSNCQLPCTSIENCHDDEVCTSGHCLPNTCGSNTTSNPASEYGACTASDQGPGICVPFTDPFPGGANGICYSAGALGTDSICTPNTYQLSTNPRSQMCAPPYLCSPTSTTMPWDGGVCVQACDPTGDGGQPCALSTTCTEIAGYDDPNLGLCL